MRRQEQILVANLKALRGNDGALAERLAQVQPADLDWAASKAGPLWATIEHEGNATSLASRYDPIAEARKLMSGLDLQKHAGIVVLGMGLGYHASEIASRMNSGGIMVVFEPNLGLLRAVLERINHTAWLGWPNVVIADVTTDRAAMIGRLEQYSVVLTQGTVLISHPPSRLMHGAAMTTFGKMVTETVAFCRTNVATALVNASRTCGNLAQNVPYYVAGANTDPLIGAAQGCPAVCVGAGPSLAGNVDLLCNPAVRSNVVVIAAQTALKPLLNRGIKPNFVTALDYSEISSRFYENLPPLPDVTLVAEPKAHPSILDSFPGPIRVCRSDFLDKMLGDLAPSFTAIKDGATVAHLSFYLAQHLGCDPIILIGQDLGFTDGMYYCPGTAIDEVWGPELGPFTTVEMMQWMRIVRHRRHLRKLDDVHGSPIYSDEQMITYLKQFERDFAEAPQRILDATEGGLAKQHTKRVALAEALKQYATQPLPALPIPQQKAALLVAGRFDSSRLKAADRLLVQHESNVRELARLTRKAISVLKRMLEHQRDHSQMDKLFEKLTAIQSKVYGELGTTFSLVNSINTVAAFKRARADRTIQYAEFDRQARQAKQIDRDRENLEWLIQACDEARVIFRSARDRIERLLGSSKKVGKKGHSRRKSPSLTAA